jgi:ribose-phosphate pyrophosphokinase
MIQVFAVSRDRSEQALPVRKLVFPGGEVNVAVELDLPAEALRIQSRS